MEHLCHCWKVNCNTSPIMLEHLCRCWKVNCKYYTYPCWNITVTAGTWTVNTSPVTSLLLLEPEQQCTYPCWNISVTVGTWAALHLSMLEHLCYCWNMSSTAPIHVGTSLSLFLSCCKFVTSLFLLEHLCSCWNISVTVGTSLFRWNISVTVGTSLFLLEHLCSCWNISVPLEHLCYCWNMCNYGDPGSEWGMGPTPHLGGIRKPPPTWRLAWKSAPL